MIGQRFVCWVLGFAVAYGVWNHNWIAVVMGCIVAVYFVLAEVEL